MTGRFGGRRMGSPLPAKPSSTWTSPRNGQTSPAGPSRLRRPRSTCCMATAPVIAFVMEAIHTTVSLVIGAPVSVLRSPNAPS